MYSEDSGDQYRLGGCQDTYPICELKKWITFYRSLREIFPKSGTSYDDIVDALDRLQAELAQT